LEPLRLGPGGEPRPLHDDHCARVGNRKTRLACGASRERSAALR
jgi:hypothetical protein